MQARMLPTDRTLSTAEIDDVREAVRDFIFDGAKRRISNSTIAKATGYTASVISQFLNGSYPGNNDEVARKLNNWLERRCQVEDSSKEEIFIRTHVVELISGTIAMAYRLRRMAAIVSPSGSGKDKVIKELTKKYNTILLYAERRSTTPTSLVRTIGDALGLRLRTVQMGDAMPRVCDALRGRDRVIIINEAQQLRPECASVIRAIYDQSDTPIILIGSMEILNFIDDRDSGGGQFSRRCIRLNILERLAVEPFKGPGGKQLEGGRPLFTADEVQKFLEARQIRLTPEAFSLAVILANLIEHGTFGLMCDVIEDAFETYVTGAKGLTRNHLLSAMTLRLGEAEYGRAHRRTNIMSKDPRYATAAG